MKFFLKTICLLALLVFAVNTQAQIINFPDANFKAKLLQASTANNIALNINGIKIKIDTNNDGEIQQSEALVVYTLNVPSSNISSLSGIEFFKNIRYLSCEYESFFMRSKPINYYQLK